MALFGRWGIFAVGLVAFMALFPQNPRQDTLLTNIPSGKTRVLDLSYAINDKLVPWPGDTRVFEAQVNATVEKNGYFTRSFWMLEHYGTHLDAPIHFPPGKTPVDQIPLKQLFGPVVVLGARAAVARDPDFQLPLSRVEEWEKDHGRIPEGAIVLLRTGWATRWPDVQRYRNQDAQGRMHFPGFSVEAVKLLIERKVSGLGCDTLSVDYGASTDFAVHHLSLGAGLYHLENLSDLSEVPESGAFLIVAPIKLEGGSGGPVRVFAVLP
jgi:kynurenine formamidase